MKTFAIIDSDNICINLINTGDDTSIYPEYDADTWIEISDTDATYVGRVYSSGSWIDKTLTTEDVIENRRIAYPPIADQLDMLYHDEVDGTTTWKDAIAQVKTDNPFPS